MKAADFLRNNLQRESKDFFGVTDSKFIDFIVSAWMDDKNNSKHRYDELQEYLPDVHRILDMASGCGTFVFYGLLNGYDVFGVEPEHWKNEFNHMKVKEYGYAESWKQHFNQSVGEKLPFKNNAFDCVSSYQTLEHVKNIHDCLSEMVRVTRSGGALHIYCPDYNSTFEGHYLLPWLPQFFRPFAKVYLKLLKKPVKGLDSINYITKSKVINSLRNIESINKYKFSIIDLNKTRTENRLKKMGLPQFITNNIYFIISMIRYLRISFTREISVAILVNIEKS